MILHHLYCRSIDDSRGETESQKVSHASIPFGSESRGLIDDVPSVSYTIKIAKTERNNPFKTPLAKYHPHAVEGIEHFTEHEVFLTFIPTKHHEKICSEIQAVLKVFFKWR